MFLHPMDHRMKSIHTGFHRGPCIYTRPLLDAYKSAGLQIDQIDVEGKTPQQVFEEFKVMLEEKPQSEYQELPVAAQ